MNSLAWLATETMGASCSYCPKVATFRVEGWVEDGESEGPAYTLVCEDHVKDFESDDYDVYNKHGYETVDAIIPLVAKNG